MARLVIWGGPVARSNLSVELEADVLTVSQGVGGIGSNAFRDLALSYLDEEGHILPRFLLSRGIAIGDYDGIILAGFSAFHGFANEVLKHDLDRVVGLLSLDACFSSFENLAKEGYVRLGEKAARGNAAVVLTSSFGGGATFSTGSQCVWATAKEVEKRTGMPLEVLGTPDGVPPPIDAKKIGDFYVLDYEDLFTHGDHVNKIGHALMQAYLVPMANGTFPSHAEPSSSGSPGLGKVFFGAGVLGLVAAVAFTER